MKKKTNTQKIATIIYTTVGIVLFGGFVYAIISLITLVVISSMLTWSLFAVDYPQFSEEVGFIIKMIGRLFQIILFVSIIFILDTIVTSYYQKKREKKLK